MEKGNITLEEFAELVKQMRHNQRRCEKFPTLAKHGTRKELEEKVDKIIATIFDTQMTLF